MLPRFPTQRRPLPLRLARPTIAYVTFFYLQFLNSYGFDTLGLTLRLVVIFLCG